MEVWKDINGYEKLYKISSYGRIKSSIGNRIMKCHITHNGYFRIGLYKGVTQKKFFAHRLVAEAFLGPPQKGNQVCHNDGDGTNNHASNLRWDTSKNNCADKLVHGTDGRGEKNVTAKLTSENIIWIRENLGTITQTKMSKILGVTVTTVNDVVKRRSWRHIQ